MSRIGKKPVAIPAGVTVSVVGNTVSAKGSKGELSIDTHRLMDVNVDGDNITVNRIDESRKSRSLHGLTRTLLANLVTGVSSGYSKELKIQGVGYRADVKGDVLNMSLGFSHPVNFKLPAGVSAKIVDKTTIRLEGISKQLVGQTAAEIRSIRPPEPYGGKGVRYSDEIVKRKEGKSGA